MSYAKTVSLLLLINLVVVLAWALSTVPPSWGVFSGTSVRCARSAGHPSKRPETSSTRSVRREFMDARTLRIPGPVPQSAERAGARTRTVDSSHVAMMSHPATTTRMIIDAARSTD